MQWIEITSSENTSLERNSLLKKKQKEKGLVRYGELIDGKFH